MLIAMPSLNDPNFNKSVTLICEHSPKDGAMGIVLNQPTSMTVQEILTELQISKTCESAFDEPVFAGGPVQTDRGFILHDSNETWNSSLTITENLYLTSSNDILEAMARGEGPENSMVVLGYAGWGPGQLEQEISNNAWLTVPNDDEIVFDVPVDKRWQAAASKLGIDLNLLAGEAGHA